MHYVDIRSLPRGVCADWVVDLLCSGATVEIGHDNRSMVSDPKLYQECRDRQNRHEAKKERLRNGYA